jgi:hypothetical protein
MLGTKAKCVDRIVKLIESIHRLSGMLALQDAGGAPAFQQWADKTRAKIDRFEFELRTELSRLGAELDGFLSHEPREALKPALEDTTELYQAALNCAIPPHTRAMLTRQSQELQRVNQEFAILSCAA